jgi:hypothetical protein
MAKDTITIKDKNFRITLSEGVRNAEQLEIGDTIEIDVKKTRSCKDEN